MLKIKNKTQSYNAIKKLNLNVFPMVHCKKGDIDKIEKFVKENGDVTYIVRDEILISRKSITRVKKEELINYVNLSERYTVEVESITYADNRVLFGDIKIGTDNSFWFVGTDDGKVSGREKYSQYKWNINTDIFDKKIDRIPNINKIIKYINDNKLENVIVEFAVFDRPVGVNNENVVIFELRTDY